MPNPVAAICSNNACNTQLHEGKSALYDDYRDQHFCRRSCFTEWYEENVEKLASEYYMLNVEPVEL